MANTSKTNKIYAIMGAMFLLVAIQNIMIGFNPRITYLDYFGYEIRITNGFRLMCILGGVFFTVVVISMMVLMIREKLAKNKAHRVSQQEWDNLCKVSPELQEKIKKSKSMSLDELEHLSDKD